MDYTFYFILCSVVSVSEMHNVTDTKNVLLKLPKEITNGTFISITGEINTIDKLSILLSGDKTDEKCRIVFNPRKQSIRVISRTENYTTYNLEHSGKVHAASTPSFELMNKNPEWFRNKSDKFPLINVNTANIVPFSLNITARTVMEQTETHFLDLDFEGNDAGPELLPRCEFKSFQSIEYIRIQGIQHLRSLLFVFDKVFI